MSSSLTLEETFEAFRKSYEYVEKQNEYLRKQLGASLQNKRTLHSDAASSSCHSHGDSKSQENFFGNSSEDGSESRAKRRRRHHHQSSHDIKVDVPEFEGRLDPNEFLDGLHTIERVF